MVVTDVGVGPIAFDRWQASCSCGFIGHIVPEELADREADEHRVEARISAAVAAERGACVAELSDWSSPAVVAAGISAAVTEEREQIAAFVFRTLKKGEPS
jgi:hypothetical protein